MKKIILFASLFILCLSVYSQTDSLTYYLGIAAKNNPSVQQKFIEYQAALQKVPQVGSLPDPELSTGIFLSPMELVSGRQVADIRLMQMFPWFGVLKNAKDEMSLMAKAKFELFREAKLQVFFEVQSTWNELQKVQQSILISGKNLEILHSLERLSLVKFKAESTGNVAPSVGSASIGNAQQESSSSSGMSTMNANAGTSGSPSSTAMPPSNSMSSSGTSGLSDLYQIQMEIGELDNNILLLKSRQQTLVARFNSYLNRPVQSQVSFPDYPVVNILDISLATVSNSMLSQSPMLGMLKYEQESLDARQQMVTKMGYPMVGLGLNYSLINKNPMSSSAMNGSDMIMPMVTVTLPIYRKKYKAMQEEVKLQKAATQQGIQATANSLQTEYYEAIQLYHDAQRRMKLYSNQQELARKSLNIQLKSFSASGSGLAELLRIRQQVLDYELKTVEAVTDNNTAIAWLKRLMAHS